jgi:hypothetical protein
MSVLRLTGNDVIKINERLISDLPHAEVGKVDFPTDIVTMKTGKNGNAIVAGNASGKQSTFELRVLRGSADDKYLNNLLAVQEQGFSRDGAPDFVALTGTLVKMIGDGAGKVISDKYLFAFGVFKKLVPAVSNVEGDVEQGIAMYIIEFASATRVIG